MELQFRLIHNTSLQQYWLTIPGAEYTVMCSWWWSEELPETYRAFYHHISVMEMGHLLTRSCLTYPEVSSKVYHDSFCQLGSSVSLPWIIYFEKFYLHVVSSFSCIPTVFPKLVLFLNPLQFVRLFFNLSKCILLFFSCISSQPFRNKQSKIVASCWL